MSAIRAHDSASYFFRASHALNPIELAVFRWLWCRGGETTCSYSYIANGLGLARSAVFKALDSMDHKGHVDIIRHGEREACTFRVVALIDAVGGSGSSPLRGGRRLSTASPLKGSAVETCSSTGGLDVEKSGGSQAPRIINGREQKSTASPFGGLNSLNTLKSLKREQEDPQKGRQAAFLMPMPPPRPPEYEAAVKLWVRLTGKEEGPACLANFREFIQSPEAAEELMRAIEGHAAFLKANPDHPPTSSLSNFIGSKAFPKNWRRWLNASTIKPFRRSQAMPESKETTEKVEHVLKAISRVGFESGLAYAGLPRELYHAARGSGSFSDLRRLSPDRLRATVRANLQAANENNLCNITGVS